MPVSEAQQTVVENLFKAMQAGPSGEEAMMSLFSEEAIFEESFSGTPKTHRGKEEIRAAFRESFNDPAPDMKLILKRTDLDGATVRADWICTSPVFPRPMAGYDVFDIREGKIVHLQVVVTDSPEPGPE